MWNCSGALRKKIEQIDTFNADILIRQLEIKKNTIFA